LLGIGDTVGDYKILAVIGSGGMGHVFKVEHAITRRVEAMKVLLRDQAGRPLLAQRFLREIQIQAGLTHPNIAAVHNAFSAGEDLVMILELVEGESLDRLMERRRIPLECGVGYVRQALTALAYAHQRGVTHRDIKPANILITTEGTLKLTDFGLAKARGDDLHLSKSGAVLGSVCYMSPEQVKGLAAVDARADLYSVGVVLYELTTGQRPFEGESAFEVMRAQLEQAPVPPVERDPALPASLNQVILKALGKKPEDRFQSAEEFDRALGEALASPGTSRPSARARRAVGAGIAAAAILVAAAWLTRTAPQKSPAVSPPPPPRAAASRETIARPLVTVAAGARLQVRTTVTISTNVHQAGEIFRAVLDVPLTAGGQLVAAKGASVEARIEASEKGGRLRGRARLAVRLIRLDTAAGAVVRISSDSVERQGAANRVRLLRHSPPAVLPAETRLEFRLLEPLRVAAAQEAGLRILPQQAAPSAFNAAAVKK